MDRYRAEYPKDDASASEGDTQFTGMNSKLSREQLPAGMVHEAVNLSFRDGKATPRRGIQTIIHFNPVLAGVNVGGFHLGSGRYADADGQEWMLVAGYFGTCRMREGVMPQSTPFPEAIATECDFVQFANYVYLFRGPGLRPWRWDGTPTGRWEMLDQLDPGDSTTPIPGAATAEVVSDRLLIATDRDAVLFSDIDNGQFYDEAQVIRVNRGTNDSLVRLFPFANGSVLAFKTRSVYLLENVTGDLSNVALVDISRSVGCVARRAVVQVGADVWFLGAAGVYRVSQVIQDRIQTDPVPVSEPIAPFFRDRVNWSAIAGAVAATLGEYFYIAVPIDGFHSANPAVHTCNAIVICNTATGQWEGWWTLPTNAGIGIRDFVEAEYHGRKRLFAIDYQGYVYLMEEGLVDRLDNIEFQIETRLVTRGYLVGTNETKDFKRVAVRVETWNPTFSVGLDTGAAAGESALLTDRTKSRTRSLTFGAPAYDRSNALDNHEAARREDYSVSVATPFQLKSGIRFETFQTSEERFPTRTRSRWASLVITGTQGATRVVETSVEARQVNRSTRTQL